MQAKLVGEYSVCSEIGWRGIWCKFAFSPNISLYRKRYTYGVVVVCIVNTGEGDVVKDSMRGDVNIALAWMVVDVFVKE